MDTLTAAYALLVIDTADTVLIILYRIYRACELTWTLKSSYRMIRAGLGTFSALLALLRIYMASGLSRLAGTELAGRYTGLAKTILTVISHYI